MTATDKFRMFYRMHRRLGNGFILSTVKAVLIMRGFRVYAYPTRIMKRRSA